MPFEPEHLQVTAVRVISITVVALVIIGISIAFPPLFFIWVGLWVLGVLLHLLANISKG